MIKLGAIIFTGCQQRCGGRSEKREKEKEHLHLHRLASAPHILRHKHTHTNTKTLRALLRKHTTTVCSNQCRKVFHHLLHRDTTEILK